VGDHVADHPPWNADLGADMTDPGPQKNEQGASPNLPRSSRAPPFTSTKTPGHWTSPNITLLGFRSGFRFSMQSSRTTHEGESCQIRITLIRVIVAHQRLEWVTYKLAEA
jgi:hypothetical protein